MIIVWPNYHKHQFLFCSQTRTLASHHLQYDKQTTPPRVKIMVEGS